MHSQVNLLPPAKLFNFKDPPPQETVMFPLTYYMQDYPDRGGRLASRGGINPVPSLGAADYFCKAIYQKGERTGKSLAVHIWQG